MSSFFTLCNFFQYGFPVKIPRKKNSSNTTTSDRQFPHNYLPVDKTRKYISLNTTQRIIIRSVTMINDHNKKKCLTDKMLISSNNFNCLFWLQDFQMHDTNNNHLWRSDFWAWFSANWLKIMLKYHSSIGKDYHEFHDWFGKEEICNK